MDLAIFTLTHGTSLGLIYALLSIGVSLVAGLMRVINFAHGEFYVLGGYFSFLLSSVFGLPILLSMGVAVLGVFLFGLLVERLVIRPTYGDSVGSLVITFILAIVLQNTFLLTFGPYPKKPLNWAHGSVEWIGGTYFGTQRLLAGAFAGLCFLAFYIFIKKTKFGKKIRAVAQDPVMAASLGVSTRRVNLISFALSCALAATAGVILAPVFPIDPFSGASITLTASVVIVIGGIGSIRGCLLGGLILGWVEALGASYLSSRYQPAYGFALMILVLLFKPSGIYGNRI